MLSEINPPFGDTAGFWTSTTVNDGQHTFQVRALNDAGTVLATNTITATVANKTHRRRRPVTPSAPSPPGNLRVDVGNRDERRVAWNAATDNVGVTGYDVYRGRDQGRHDAATTAYLINGLTCGAGYSVGVERYDAPAMRRRRRRCRSRPPRAPTPSHPPHPSNVTASNRTTTSISLTWAPATDNVGVAAYGIYNGANLIDTTAGTTGIVSNLTCGTNYTLSVDAFDASGNSSPKTTIMVSTLPCTDTTAPTATMTSPANGSTVTGTINSVCQRHGQRRRDTRRVLPRRSVDRERHKLAVFDRVQHDHDRQRQPHVRRPRIRRGREHRQRNQRDGHGVEHDNSAAFEQPGLSAAGLPRRNMHRCAARNNAHTERQPDDHDRRGCDRRPRHHRPGRRERTERHDPQHADPQQLHVR